jgi:hypothetical protein
VAHDQPPAGAQRDHHPRRPLVSGQRWDERGSCATSNRVPSATPCLRTATRAEIAFMLPAEIAEFLEPGPGSELSAVSA